jgi:transcriptional regulator with XRE-family HTH domain
VSESITIPLGSRKHPGKVAVIDAEDAPLVAQYTWTVYKGRSTFYAMSQVRRDPGGHPTRVTLLLMHRLILGVNGDASVDHWDGDGLNNRRGNLRLASESQNQGNRRKTDGTTSRYKGVSLTKPGGPFQAAIYQDRRRFDLGRFHDEEEAARAYDAAARQRFGEFAAVNFPAIGERSALTGAIELGPPPRGTPAWLRALRKQTGLRQFDFADRLGVHRSSVARWEAGIKRMSSHSVTRIEAMMATYAPDDPDGETAILLRRIADLEAEVEQLRRLLDDQAKTA